jgi:hypothetical protein
MKHYLDKYRGSLPPELLHLDGHRVMDEQSTINTYREWNGLKCIRNVTVEVPAENAVPARKVTHTLLLNGGIDDLLYNDMGRVVVFDVKTKDKEPDDDYGEKYYTTQVNSYAFMLKENGFEVADYAYLWYWWPIRVGDGGDLRFGQKLLKMPVDMEAVPNQLESIAKRLPTVSFEALKYRQFFKPSPDCGHCSYVQERNDYEISEKNSLAGATG